MEAAPQRSPEQEALDAAIARGAAVARTLVEARDALFEPMRQILRIAGADSLAASVLGVQIAVLDEIKRGAK